jgi:hypothetical protein
MIGDHMHVKVCSAWLDCTVLRIDERAIFRLCSRVGRCCGTSYVSAQGLKSFPCNSALLRLDAIEERSSVDAA